jgi:hypothetical protein
MRTVALMVALAAAGCGGGVDCSSAMLNVSGSAMIVSLSADGKRSVCDYTACQVGGYGAKLSCASGPALTVAGSQQQCLAQLPTDPSCHATVDDLVACTAAIAANPCVGTLFSSACDAVSQPECLTFTPNGLATAIAY